MQALELVLIIGLVMAALTVHRLGVPRILRTVGSACWARAAAWEAMRSTAGEHYRAAQRHARGGAA